MYIYKTTNKINGKIYIGLSKFEPGENPNYIGSGYLLKEAIKKYGKENFGKEIIEESDSKEYILQQERYGINYYRSREREVGYNLCEGGTWGDNGEHHPNKENFCKRRSELTRGKNNPRYGDHRTWEELFGKEKAEERKKEKSQEMKNENPSNSEEVKEKLSETKKGMNNPRACRGILVDPEGNRYIIEGGYKRKIKKFGLTAAMFYKKDDEGRYSSTGGKLKKDNNYY